MPSFYLSEWCLKYPIPCHTIGFHGLISNLVPAPYLTYFQLFFFFFARPVSRKHSLKKYSSFPFITGPIFFTAFYSFITFKILLLNFLLVPLPAVYVSQACMLQIPPSLLLKKCWILSLIQCYSKKVFILKSHSNYIKYFWNAVSE